MRRALFAGLPIAKRVKAALTAAMSSLHIVLGAVR
jgi:hypothetical protein